MINCRIRKAGIEKRARKLLVSNKTQYPHVNTINMFTVLTTNGRHGRRKKPLTLKTQFRYKHLVTAQSLLQKKTNKKKKIEQVSIVNTGQMLPLDKRIRYILATFDLVTCRKVCPFGYQLLLFIFHIGSHLQYAEDLLHLIKLWTE